MTGQMGDNESSVQLISPAPQLQDYQVGPVDGQRRRKLETLLIEEPVNSQNGRASSSRRKSTTHRSTRASLLRLWWAELLAASFSLACIIVQAGLLRMLNDKPLETWRLIRTHINPNTLISILATLNRSSLLLYVTQGIAQLKWPYFQRQSHRLSDLQVFDDASRGPLGSLHLLWSVNTKATLACLGAIIMILALFMEPFTQQIIAPHFVVMIANNESASIAATNLYFADPTIVPAELNVEYQSTILSALTHRAADAPYKCPSGTCTWSEYSSLGICNSCKDVIQEAQISCGPLQQPFRANSSDFLEGMGLCTYIIPSSVGDSDFFWTLWAREVTSSQNGTQQSTAYYPSTWWNTTVKRPSNESVSPGLVNITNLMFDDTAANPTSLDAAYDLLPNITRCSMTWCKQIFNASYVENGTIYDHSTSSVPIYVDSNSDIHHVGSFGLYPAWVGEQAISDTDLESWLADPVGASDEAYFVDPWFSSNIPTLLAEILSYTYFSSGGAEWDVLDITNTTDQEGILNALLPSTKSGGNTLGWSQQVFEDYNGQNISAVLDNVAVALTNLIRQSRNATSVQGSVHRPTIVIRIRWPWFTYPASISALSIVFLALVITLSHRKGELVWKASSAALAFHGLHGGQDARVNLVDALKISDAAKSEWVKLAADDDGRLALRTS
ncbi:hypothetical protein LTR27_005579 [Elasticomyces elasticus]|nr:hypothetical protein LTR27_005579 [Elasticomyces elasticus]